LPVAKYRVAHSFDLWVVQLKLVASNVSIAISGQYERVHYMNHKVQNGLK